jgi:hypothetical protein
MAADEAFQKFSTRSIAQGQRFDYWMSVLNDSMWRVTEWSDIPQDFNVELSSARLGSLTTLSESISSHRSRRTRIDLGKSAERSYHLFVSVEPTWGFSHLGANGRLNSGDVLMLAEGEHETICPFRLSRRHPEMSRGLDADVDAGPRNARRPDAGARLEVGPRAVADPPPDDAGAGGGAAAAASRARRPARRDAGLVAGDADGQAMPDLVELIREDIRERCGDAALAADDIAAAINIPARVLHRALATANSSFAAELVSRKSCRRGLHADVERLQAPDPGADRWRIRLLQPGAFHPRLAQAHRTRTPRAAPASVLTSSDSAQRATISTSIRDRGLPSAAVSIPQSGSAA